jgi:hypothetical protein
MTIPMEHHVHWILYEDMLHSDAWSALGSFVKNAIKASEEFLMGEFIGRSQRLTYLGL